MARRVRANLQSSQLLSLHDSGPRRVDGARAVMLACGTLQGQASEMSDKASNKSSGIIPQQCAPTDPPVTYNDCWWKAAEVAVAFTSPSHIKSLFLDPDNGQQPYDASEGSSPWASNPLVALYSPLDYHREGYRTDIHYRERIDDKGSQDGFFWPDALTQAMRQASALYNLAAYDHATGNLTGAYPRFDTALSILTGKPAWVHNFTSIANTPDELWELFRAKDYTKTPMMLNTKFAWEMQNNTVGDLKLEHTHVYPITDTYINGTTGSKMVGTRNVWGRTDNFTMAEIWLNAQHLAHLTNWDALS
jgi:hypothetical protein